MLLILSSFSSFISYGAVRVVGDKLEFKLSKAVTDALFLSLVSFTNSKLMTRVIRVESGLGLSHKVSPSKRKNKLNLGKGDQ